MAIKDPALASLEASSQNLIKQLKSSPTARFGEQEPNYSDMAKQKRLLQIQDQIKQTQDKTLRERWYGKQKPPEEIAPEEKSKPGLMARAVDTISQPLYGVVGATEYAFGNKANKKSLVEAIDYNRSTSKRTFGDITKEANLPGAMPIGFMLDMAFDPVNWATMGSTAIVPRVGLGITKGLAKGSIKEAAMGAARGAESRLLEGALTAGNVGKIFAGAGKKIIPGAKKEIVEKTPGIFERFMKGVENEAARATTAYDEITGRDFLNTIASRGQLPLGGATSEYRLRAGDLIREIASKNDTVNKYFKYFDYNNAEWTRLARIRDQFLKETKSADIMKQSMKVMIAADKEGLTYEQALAKGLGEAETMLKKRLEDMPATNPPEPVIGDIDDTAAVDAILNRRPNVKVQAAVDDMEDSKDILNNPVTYMTSDKMENAMRMAQEATGQQITSQDLEEILGKRDLGETGWQYFDDLKQKTLGLKAQINGKEYEIGKGIEKTLDVYSKYMTMFKMSKIGASLTAWTNAVIGNPTMAWMSGINIMDPMYIKRTKDSWNIVRGKTGSDILLNQFLNSGDFIEALRDEPTLFSRTTGLSVQHLQAKGIIESMKDVGIENGIFDPGVADSDVAKVLSSMQKEMREKLHSLFVENKNSGKNLFKPKITAEVAQGAAQAGGEVRAIIPPNPTTVSMNKVARGEALDPNDFYSGLIQNEVLDQKGAAEMLNYIKQKAKEGNNPFWKLMDFSINKMSAAYEGIDQSFKLGTTMYASMDGLTEKELAVVARNIKLAREDITKVVKDGITRYQLSPSKSLELANEAYLNYNAMPAAVKVLKNMPLVGFPFASFTYGMTSKVGKTLVNNPAFFSKANSALKDFSGEKTPLEKGVLKNPMYSYLNDPTMYKVPNWLNSPFFEKNAIYLNLAGMLPYYSLNMFAQNNRSYKDLYSDRIIGAIDKSPFAKDPVAQTIFDYYIQPLILKETIDRPQGSFGQALYPIDATPLEKFGIAMRGMGETVVPGFWAIPGGLATGKFAPGMSNYLPSYRGRQIANAMQGQNQLGISGKEDPWSRTGRSLLNSAGIALQTPIPFTNLPTYIKNKVK